MKGTKLVPLSETRTATRDQKTVVVLLEAATGRVLHTVPAGASKSDVYDLYRRAWRKANGVTRSAWQPGDAILY